MTNYEKITSMSKSEMRKFITGFSIENIDKQFCENGCPYRKELEKYEDFDDVVCGKCPSDSYVARWWLEQEYKGV